MTLKDVIDQLMADLHARGSKVHKAKLRKRNNHSNDSKSKSQLLSSQGFDFIRILECSSVIKPILKFYRRLKERSKRKYFRSLEKKHFVITEEVDEEKKDTVAASETKLKELEPQPEIKTKTYRNKEQSVAEFIK